MAPPPEPSIFQSAKEWADSIPIITRFLTFSTLAFSLAAKFEVIKPVQLILATPPILERYEIYRFVTAHLFSVGSGMIWHLFLLYQNSRGIEEGAYSSRPADYAFLVILMMAYMDVVGTYLGFMLLTDGFGMAITTLYANSNRDQIVNFMFGFQFKAIFLPWGFLMGGSWELPALGISAGYLAYYIDIVYPSKNDGRKLISTPSFLVDWFPPPTSGGFGGAAPGAGEPGPPTRTRWGGGGRRLGS